MYFGNAWEQPAWLGIVWSSTCIATKKCIFRALKSSLSYLRPVSWGFLERWACTSFWNRDERVILFSDLDIREQNKEECYLGDSTFFEQLKATTFSIHRCLKITSDFSLKAWLCSARLIINLIRLSIVIFFYRPAVAQSVGAWTGSCRVKSPTRPKIWSVDCYSERSQFTSCPAVVPLSKAPGTPLPPSLPLLPGRCTIAADCSWY